jgi:membrane fusion protein
MKFFRNEALQAHHQKQYGTILLAQPLGFWLYTAFFFALGCAMVGFFFLAGFSRKEIVTGVLVPEHGLTRVYTPQSGMILEKKVGNGQMVKKDDVLFVLSGERVSSTKGNTQVAVTQSLVARLENLQSELKQQHSQSGLQLIAMQKRQQQLEEQLLQIGKEIELRQKRVQLAEAATRRAEELKKANYFSDAQLQEKLVDVLEQQSGLRALERNRNVIQTELLEVQANLQERPLSARREALALARAASEVEQSIAQNEAARQFVVRAPQSGMLSGINLDLGQVVNTNQMLAAIVPPGEKLVAELYAPTKAIGFVKPGTQVLVRYQAFPWQKFGQHQGVVQEVAEISTIPADINLPFSRAANSTDPLYRIKVKMENDYIRAYGRDERLRPGMQLDASLVLEHRKLYEWVIDPVYAITGRM